MNRLWTSTRQALAVAWQQRAPRERRLLTLGAVVLLTAAVWSLCWAPAWRVWREAPARQASLEAQTRHMLQLQAEARLLQSPSHIDRSAALQLLNTRASQLLGSKAQLKVQGDELRVTLQAASASALAQWLSEAREKAQTRPRLAQLQKQDEAGSPTWSGTLVLSLP